MDFHDGLEIGRQLEKVRHLETDVVKLQHDVGEIQNLIKRGAILVALWGGALVLALTSERGPEVVASIVRTLLAKGS